MSKRLRPSARSSARLLLCLRNKSPLNCVGEEGVGRGEVVVRKREQGAVCAGSLGGGRWGDKEAG